MSLWSLPPLIAHSWGWDEVLMFAVPLVVAFFGIRWAERRAAQRHDESIEAPGDDASPPS